MQQESPVKNRREEAAGGSGHRQRLQGPRTRTVVLTSSSAAYAIVDYARDHGIDLIVTGTHGRGALGRHLVMGSVAEKVVRVSHRAPC